MVDFLYPKADLRGRELRHTLRQSHHTMCQKCMHSLAIIHNSLVYPKLTFEAVDASGESQISKNKDDEFTQSEVPHLGRL